MKESDPLPTKEKDFGKMADAKNFRLFKMFPSAAV